MSRFTSHIVKKILGALIIVGCSGIFLNGYVGVNEAYAQNNGTQNTTTPGSIATPEAQKDDEIKAETQDNSMGIREILNLFLKLIYLLLWPLLVVAGLSLDNTLVYASIFHLDAPLWKFWNMMKNFANFTLGFMVLFAIIKSLVTGSGEGSFKDDKTPLGIIKKTLIAGVLIQASWFLMAALVDVSTIATYAVGGLPLSVLKNTDIGKQKILMVNSEIDLDKFTVFSEEGAGFKVRYSTMYNGKKLDISPCKIKSNFIIGREFGGAEFKHSTVFQGTPYAGYEVCVAFTNQLAMWEEDKFMEAILQEGYRGHVSTPIEKPNYNNEAGYKAYIKNLTDITGRQKLDIVKQYAINLDFGSKAPGIVMGSGFFNQTISMTISELINKSKGFVGPLVTMYSSLLNFAQLTDTQTTTLGETSGIFLIKSLVAIALFFPLLALAVVLVARIGLLWLYIAGSPFLIIKAVFDKLIPKEALGNLDKHLDLGNVIKLIFAPVVTVAALSISLIFMTALLNGFKSDNNQQISNNVAQNLNITPIKTTPGNQKFQFSNSVNVEFKNFDRGGSLDRFSWLVVNFFAIGILRTILFAAIKSNALGEKIGGGIQEFGSNVFQTLPIIPFNKGTERVGVGSAFRELNQAPSRRVEERIRSQEQTVREYIEGTGAAPTFSGAQAETIIQKMKSGSDINTAVESAGLKVPRGGITTTWNTPENISTIYEAINSPTLNLSEAEKTTEATKWNTIFGADWLSNEAKRIATQEFKTKIEDKITKDLDETALKKLFNDNPDQSKKYFTTNEEFTKTLDDGKTTIKVVPVKNSTKDITDYTVTKTTTS